MKNIVIQIVPFCYGPTSIAIALARKLKETLNCQITALCESPSLDLVSCERNIFSEIVRQDLSAYEYDCLFSADLVLSICDFDFVESHLKKFPEKKIVLIDPLLWMWERVPNIVTQCDLYLALEFPGVAKIVSGLSNERVIMIPQIAEFNGIRDTNVSRDNILVNLGGMQSPLGANVPLALAMCEEIINAVRDDEFFDHVDIRTSKEISEILLPKLPKYEWVTIKSSTPRIFHAELAKCLLLLSVPGMSIIYESVLAQARTLFILPLNYSQHLQIKSYRNMFSNISEISFQNFSKQPELPYKLKESEGVYRATTMGRAFANSKEMRNEFQKRIRNHLRDWEAISALSSSVDLECSGASKTVEMLEKFKLI